MPLKKNFFTETRSGRGVGGGGGGGGTSWLSWTGYFYSGSTVFARTWKGTLTDFYIILYSPGVFKSPAGHTTKADSSWPCFYVQLWFSAVALHSYVYSGHDWAAFLELEYRPRWTRAVSVHILCLAEQRRSPTNGDSSVVMSAGLVIERSWVRVAAGVAEELYSAGSAFCADSYFGIPSTPVLPQ